MDDTKGWINGLRCEACDDFCELDGMPVNYSWSTSGLESYACEFPCRRCGKRELKVIVVQFSKKGGWKTTT